VFLPWHSAKGQAGLRQRCRLCRVFCCHSTQQRFRHRQLAVPYLFFFLPRASPALGKSFTECPAKSTPSLWLPCDLCWGRHMTDPLPSVIHPLPSASSTRYMACIMLWSYWFELNLRTVHRM
jgi:hypothetical protein